MEKEKALFRVHFSSLSSAVAGLPFFATLFCVTWSVLFNFKESTATHCRVRYLKILFYFHLCGMIVMLKIRFKFICSFKKPIKNENVDKRN